MSILNIKNLQMSYGTLPALADISLTLARGEKVALVGHNGVGKTTLLKIIAGLISPDTGTIEIPKGTRVGYLPQETQGDFFGVDENIIDYLKRVAHDIAGYNFEHQVKIILAGFGLKEISLDHKVAYLSSGQKSKIILAGILLQGTNLLLLDEPTNNLDLPALLWLEEYLQNTKAACIIISHDRRFMDRVISKIFEINWRTHELTSTNGKYSDYLEMKAKQVAREKEAHVLQQEDIVRLQEQAREQRAHSERGARFVGTDNNKHQQGYNRNKAGVSAHVAKTIEKRIELMDKIEKPVERGSFEIKLDADKGSGTLDVRLIDVVAGYMDGFKTKPISFEIKYGSRIGIMGLNGSGKSTLLKTITKELTSISGKLEIGSSVRIGNMMQEHQNLPQKLTPLEFLKERTNLDLSLSYSKLSNFGFSEKQTTLPISTLSPGERTRLLLALFSVQKVNMLILDEPTNHLDLEALVALEETLSNYLGTILLVSHDRYFIEKALLDTVYVLLDEVLTKSSDYREYIISLEEIIKKF